VWVAATQVAEGGDETALLLLVAAPGLGGSPGRRLRAFVGSLRTRVWVARIRCHQWIFDRGPEQ